MNDPRYDIRVVSEHAKTARRDNKKLISRLRKIKPRKLDEVFISCMKRLFVILIAFIVPIVVKLSVLLLRIKILAALLDIFI